MAEQMDKELRGAYERLVMHMYFHQVLGVEIHMHHQSFVSSITPPPFYTTL